MSRPLIGRLTCMTIEDSRTRWLALYVLCLGTLMIVLDTTIVNVALPSIRRPRLLADVAGLGRERLPAHLRRLPSARRPARRPVRAPAAVPVGIALFTVASLACGLSTTQGMLIARARGAGRRRRHRLGDRALADDGAVHRARRAREGDGRGRLRRGRAAARIGVLLGGVLTDVLSWHWIFFVNVPIGVASSARSCCGSSPRRTARRPPRASMSPAP